MPVPTAIVGFVLQVLALTALSNALGRAVVPVAPWSLAVAALTLAAATGAPALLLARWSIRTTGRGVAAGVAAGLVASVFLAGLGLTEPVATRGAESWAAWLAHWPALVGLPLALVVSWLLRARRGAVDRGALPPGLGDLHG